MEQVKDLGMTISNGWPDSNDVANMLDEIRERYMQMELELNTKGDMCIDSHEVIERLNLLKYLRDSFADDAKSRTAQTKE